MTMKRILLAALMLSSFPASAQDRIELDTTVIKGNTELPKILYVVPWKDAQGRTSGEQKLTLHSLFGDVFEPVAPKAPIPEIR